MLAEADRRGKPADEIHRRFGHAERQQTERLQVLALALFEQNIEAQGGFARTGKAGQDNELILGDGQGEVLEVVQASAAEEDGVGHRGVGSGEWGVENGEWGVENGERRGEG